MPSSPVAAARAAPSCRPRPLLQAAVDDGGGLGVLPRAARLHRSGDFTEVVRRGRRAARATLTVHLLPGQVGAAQDGAARAGLVVSKAVGGSVVRSTVSRRLRHLLRTRLDALPPGSRLVVRASPAAATASSAVLGDDLDAALLRAQRAPGARS